MTTEIEYLRNEIQTSKAAIRRTVSDMGHTAGAVLQPRRIVRRYPLTSTLSVLGGGFVAGLTLQHNSSRTPGKRGWAFRLLLGVTRYTRGLQIEVLKILAGASLAKSIAGTTGDESDDSQELSSGD